MCWTMIRAQKQQHLKMFFESCFEFLEFWKMFFSESVLPTTSMSLLPSLLIVLAWPSLKLVSAPLSTPLPFDDLRRLTVAVDFCIDCYYLCKLNFISFFLFHKQCPSTLNYTSCPVNTRYATQTKVGRSKPNQYVSNGKSNGIFALPLLFLKCNALPSQLLKIVTRYLPNTAYMIFLPRLRT